MDSENSTIIDDPLKCRGCGAALYFIPGTKHLKCDYCGNAETELPITHPSDVQAVDFDDFVAETRHVETERRQELITCNNCGSKTTFDKNVTAQQCGFCATPLVIELATNENYIKPHYILPFAISKDIAILNLQQWIKGLWFAPNDLKRRVNSSSTSPLKGIYLPYWLYDSSTYTEYTGRRGDYYYENESYTERVNGQDKVKTRRVRRTAWSSVSGDVCLDFKDISVTASRSLPKKSLDALEPWAISKLQNFDERFISGFSAESFKVKPDEGFKEAKELMESKIRNAIRKDIGGDEQQISSASIEYNEIGIKYTLLPVWVSSFKYNKRVYQFLVNASTGEVIGKRPYSAAKIILLIVVILIIIGMIRA